jgi:hypothetical protein
MNAVILVFPTYWKCAQVVTALQLILYALGNTLSIQESQVPIHHSRFGGQMRTFFARFYRLCVPDEQSPHTATPLFPMPVRDSFAMDLD